MQFYILFVLIIIINICIIISSSSIDSYYFITKTFGHQIKVCGVISLKNVIMEVYFILFYDFFFTSF